VGNSADQLAVSSIAAEPSITAIPAAMEELPMLKSLSVDRFVKPSAEFAPGPAPMLTWIDTDKLVVDDGYQRDIGRRGAINIGLIAQHFDWSKFAPVIVAPVEGGQYAIVDGQHRTTAAMMRGQTSVPCQVVQADRAKQAAAYAAVNGNVTKTTPNQLFNARLEAGEPLIKEVASACAAAGVKVVRTNKTQAKMHVGETVASAALTKCFQTFGRETFVAALMCITKTGNGNPGFVRSTIVEALCSVLVDHPEWIASPETLVRNMSKFSFPDVWGKIVGDHDQVVYPSAVKSQFVEVLTKHLTRKFATPTHKAA
jgi:hypothetical protein